MPTLRNKGDKKVVRFSITIPKELFEKMKKHPDVPWNKLAIRAFEWQLKVLEMLEQTAEPGITDEEAARRVIETRRRLLKERGISGTSGER